MKLTLHGHDDLYAVEQLQMSLFGNNAEGAAQSRLIRSGTYITASTTDGSNLSARCDITSESGIGVGVSAIWSDTTTRVDVYNLNGQLLIKDADCDDFRRLLPGIYIAAGRKVIKR